MVIPGNGDSHISLALDTQSRLPTPRRPVLSPGLQRGDRARRDEFLDWYEKMPDGFKAELIDEEVFVAPPVGTEHGRFCSSVTGWIHACFAETRGTEAYLDDPVQWDNRSVPQPEVAVVVLPEFGGRATLPGNRLKVAPKLVVEVAASSADIDLHRKKSDYERAGVGEYAVVVVDDRAIRWFVRSGDALVDATVAADGLFRSAVFPGLWLDPGALFARDDRRVVEVAQRGVASPGHAAFVETLAQARIALAALAQTMS